MSGFFGVFGDWRHRDSEFSLERAVDAISGRAPVGTQVEFVNPNGYHGLSSRDRAMGFGLGLLNVTSATTDVAQTACGQNGAIIAIVAGHLTNLPIQAQELGISIEDTTPFATLVVEVYRRWGIGGFAKLEGSWAAAILDGSTRQLVLAIDHFGSRPLFYGILHGQFVFGTCLRSITSFAAVRSASNSSAVHDFLTGSASPSEQTLVRGIRRLAPAHAGALKYDVGALRHWPIELEPTRYWRSTGNEQSIAPGLQPALSRVRDLLSESLQGDVGTAKIPVVGLSGGLHSASILLSLRRSTEQKVPINALTLVGKNSATSKTRHADVAVHAATPAAHAIEPVRLEGSQLEEMASILGDPVGDTTTCLTFMLLSQARERGYTTLVTGTGGARSLATNFDSWCQRLGEYLSDGEVRAGIRYAWSRRQLASLRELYDCAVRQAWPSPIVASTPFAALPDFFSEKSDHREFAVAQTEFSPTTRKANGLRVQLENSTTLASAFSMQHRAPLVTVGLAEAIETSWAQRLECSVLDEGSLFAAAMRGIVPNEILDQRVPVSPPILVEQDILCDNSDWVLDVLHDDAIGCLPVHAQLLRERWLLMLKGKAVYDPVVWRWINLALWARAHRVSFG
ncbi:MAG: asparagine synthase-related protein [Hyphomicrobiaceae bacterium]